MNKNEPDVGAILVGKLNRFSERRKVIGLKKRIMNLGSVLRTFGFESLLQWVVVCADLLFFSTFATELVG